MENPVFIPLTNEEKTKRLQKEVSECKTLEDTLHAINKLKNYIKVVYKEKNKAIEKKCLINKNRVSNRYPDLHPAILKFNNEDETYKGKGLKCYVCKDRFKEVHHFYHSMCPECAKHNYEKRTQTGYLTGKLGKSLFYFKL